jgi:hypothetical protein
MQKLFIMIGTNRVCTDSDAESCFHVLYQICNDEINEESIRIKAFLFFKRC